MWFILLQLTKRFRFQKNKNVRFISGNFSSDRFSRKVKTIRYGLHILINKHLQYRCLEFTILKCTWWIFAKKIINFSLEFRIKTFCLRSLQMIMKQNLERQIRQLFGRAVTGIIYLQSFFQYLLLLYAPRLTCRFHFVGKPFNPQEFIRNLKHLSYSTFVILILRKIFACPSDKLSTEFTSPIAKCTSPGLLDTTFFARWLTHSSVKFHIHWSIVRVYIYTTAKLSGKALLLPLHNPGSYPGFSTVDLTWI